MKNKKMKLKGLFTIALMGTASFIVNLLPGVLIGTVILSKHFKADTPASQTQEKTNGRF